MKYITFTPLNHIAVNNERMSLEYLLEKTITTVLASGMLKCNGQQNLKLPHTTPPKTIKKELFCPYPNFLCSKINDIYLNPVFNLVLTSGKESNPANDKQQCELFLLSEVSLKIFFS